MKRSYKLQLWLNEKEQSKLQRLAAQEMITMSEFIRLLINQQPDPIDLNENFKD